MACLIETYNRVRTMGKSYFFPFVGKLPPGRKQYIEKGGKLGRKVGSVKTEEQVKAEYREVISLLRKGYSIRDMAKLSGKGVNTVQRVKRLIKVQSSQSILC